MEANLDRIVAGRRRKLARRGRQAVDGQGQAEGEGEVDPQQGRTERKIKGVFLTRFWQNNCSKKFQLYLAKNELVKSEKDQA